MQASSDPKGPAQRLVAPASPSDAAADPITIYHWLVVFFASAGWLFDCMGQRIFVLSREPALRELLGATASDGDVKYWGGIATLLMMVGWATGGILFGMMSDHYGRVKAMVTTLLAYTLFSGLSGFAHTGVEFLIFRFLFGLGVGGMFGAATTLVAESVPRRFRTMALGSMQALSACGNMVASGLSLRITPGMENFWGHYSGWQVLSFVSVFPAILAVPMVLILKEPQAWIKAKAEAATGGCRQSRRLVCGPVPASALAPQHAGGHLPRRRRHGGVVGHRFLLPGTDHDGLQEPALAGRGSAQARRTRAPP